MFIAYIVIASILAAVLLGSATAKFTRPQRLVDQMSTLAVSYSILPFLGVVQITGALGLVAGFWWGPLGTAAAIGVALYFVGAVAAHLRARDIAGTAPAAALGVIAVITVGLGVATL